MAFNPLKEKGTPLDKQLRNWEQVVQRCYDKSEVDPYTRSRQILMNGIEMQSWAFKHMLSRITDNPEIKNLIAKTRMIEDQQQTTINWLAPADQSVLETTLAFEQVATDLTAYLAKIETDNYVRKVFDFGLLEDFDHLYRYSQFYEMMEGKNPDKILKSQTDVFPGRPTQDHHNEPTLVIRKHYDKNTADPATKVNILTLTAGEQQTHNFYKEHGYKYGNPVLRKLYAEIAQVEELHVSMYESLMDPTETLLEKLLLHEFTEVCNYYTFVQQEPDDRIRDLWEMFMFQEIEHLHIASRLLEKYEHKEAAEIIGNEIHEPSRFESQKKYVEKILNEQVDLRITDSVAKDFTPLEDLPEDWPSYAVQEKLNEEGSPSEMTVRLRAVGDGRDLVLADEQLKKKEASIIDRGLDKVEAPNTIAPEELEEMMRRFKVNVK